MEEKLNQLKARLAEITALNNAIGVLGWDLQVNLPPGGFEGRGKQLAALETIVHQKSTSEEIGRLLEDLEKAGFDPDSDEARLVKVTARHYRKRTLVPPQLVVEMAEASSIGHEIWQRARANNDFASFQPQLEKLVDLARHYAALFAPSDHIYDPLLDDYEPGMKTAEVKEIFGALRKEQVALIREIAAQPQVDNSFLQQEYTEQAQWDFGVEVMTAFGYDWKRGRQDRSAHPFTSGFGTGDVRLTTRIIPNMPLSALMSSMHECGHALYEQGLNPQFVDTPLANAASMALHESQSRMWENLVGRSLPFWKHYFPRMQQYFPAQLGNVSLQDFYRAVNRVEPSLIRVEADEATYNLHIMLRMEIEIALMEGSLQVRDLPEVWNTRMQEYLGVTPPNDTLGVLQDVHWSGGMFGYFPTYALGNLVSAQLWEKINAAIPDLDQQIEAGKFDCLLDWLRANIHMRGSKCEPQELVQMVTGEKINPQPYLRYLRSKYSGVYNLK
ncbi:MAG TPA: carboxypeptidase M32 [Anaerolineaceae bacterium]